MDYVQVSPQFGGSAILGEVPARLGGSDCVLTCAPTALFGPSFYLPCLPHTHRVVYHTHKGRFAMCLQGIILSASPLARLGAVLESRNADAIPFPISLNMVVGNVLWAMFGFYVNDHVIFLPSVVGYTLGMTQILVILWCWGYLPYDLAFLKFIFSSRHSSPETTIEMTVRERDHPEYIDTAEDGAHCDSGEEEPEEGNLKVKDGSVVKLTDLESGTLVALAIRALGVGHIFTLTGGHISPILVGCNAVGIKVVDTRDEKAAVFAADAYARLTGNIGVCAVTAGPGLTNAVTAIVNARMAEVPIMVLAGATSMILKGRGSLQDIDQGALVKSAVKSQTTVKSVKEIIPAVLRASAVAG
ncbi:acetolactate synthase, putative, partial [Perkinsus marinus ATCC 50983]